MRQLTLPVELRPESDFAEYLPGPNAEAHAAAVSWSMGRGERFLYLFGPPGSGRTHLLQAACRSGAGEGLRVVYLPLEQLGLEPAVLEDLERVDLVALDDVQRLAGGADWELALFSLYNRLREAGGRLLISGDAPVAELAIGLPDLRSRLGWGPTYRLQALGEADCVRLVREAAARRGLTLKDDAVAYLMRRAPREPGPLLALLAELDRLCLQDQRRPTVPMLRRILEAEPVSGEGGSANERK
jgi:DnaA-homolog protein